ncbi:NAD(P)/FAD-dependent oxidoreductase [Kitasatospora sp. MBT63]|uniref:FAD-dependent oxidoreductase n=1 Tax=Kitasatospora sp. MBT63 TaxID=1444768 RepID=UPI000539EBA1|nr:FAD-dependent monooxygenase [Kitasatospora sp. MBT63]
MAKITVIGGGIAGAAAALGLHRAGFEVEVYEAHPDTGADIGAFLTLASNGMRALAQLDAAAAVAELGFPLTTMDVLDGSGEELAAMPLGESGHPLTRYRCLRRAALAATLRQEVLRRGVPIRHSARLVTVTEDRDGVTAAFADGSSARADLLVGADGLHSAVRGQLDAAAPRPDYAGQQVFYGYTTGYTGEAVPPSQARSERITMIRGSGAAFGYALSPAGETFWFARVPGPPADAEELAGTGADGWRERLLPLLRPDRTAAAEIVAATADRLMVTNALHLGPGTRWRGERTVLIGDAAHAASPATGQGASMALEDAVVLAKALREGGPGTAALEHYERLRRPRTELNAAVSARLTAGGTGPRTPVVAADRPTGTTAVDEELLRLLDWNTPLPTGS